MPSHEEQMKCLAKTMKQDFLDEPASFLEGMYKIKCSQFCGRKDEPANQTQAGGTVIRSSTVLDGRASCWKRTALVHDSIRTPPMSS